VNGSAQCEAIILGASTGTVSGFGLTAVFFAVGLLVPLGLLGGAVGWALAPDRR